jgi:hypothetical protein
LLHGRFIEAGLPDIERTPGYPLFLALVSLGGPVAAALAHVILSLLSVVLVARLARAVFADDRIVLAAAWIFAFEPLSFTYSILLMSETLFQTLLLLSLERLAVFLRSRSLPALAAAGLWLAAATFVRPVTYYLPMALAVGLFWALALVPGLRWKAPAVLLLSVLPWLAAWQIRNWVETGFSGFSSVQEQNLYFFSAAEVIGRVEHRPLAQVQSELGNNDEPRFLERHPEAVGWSQAQRVEFMGAEARRVLRAHPGVFLLMSFNGSMRTALNPGAAVLLSLMQAPVDDSALAREGDEGPMRAVLWTVRTYPWQTAVMAVLGVGLLGLYVFALLGAVCGGAPRSCLWLLLGVSLYFFAVSGGAPGGARYRLPVMPIVCILAAAGVMRRRIIQ